MSEIYDDKLQQIEDAVDAAYKALGDWAASLAPEEFPEERVDIARSRINYAGSLSYIAGVLEELRIAKRNLQ